MALTFRPLTAADLPALHDLEAEAYRESLLVSDEALLRLITLFPDGAVGAFDDEGLCGFIFGLPLKAGMTLELQAALDAIPLDADVFYIHDIAVANRCRGCGVGRQLAARAIEIGRARGFTRAELVSVQGSAPFWERFGFRVVREFEYAPGAPAVQMAAEI
jgi:ribosomal protein S18 acetylase RimI-like enzyme